VNNERIWKKWQSPRPGCIPAFWRSSWGKARTSDMTATHTAPGLQFLCFYRLAQEHMKTLFRGLIPPRTVRASQSYRGCAFCFAVAMCVSWNRLCVSLMSTVVTVLHRSTLTSVLTSVRFSNTAARLSAWPAYLPHHFERSSRRRYLGSVRG
jgi:hypothetical protein